MNINNYYKPLDMEPSAEDYLLHNHICSTELMTKRLRELVPLLEVIDYKVEKITLEETVLSTPLLEAAMNQNGTHQASVFYLMADYTTGIGMMGALPGIYVSAIHERTTGQPIQYWLKKSTVEHLRPGTGPITSRIHIPEEERLRMRRDIIKKGHTEYTGRVEFFQNGQNIALSYPTMGMYADNPRIFNKRPRFFQIQNALLMALLDLGLHTSDKEKAVAGDQGRGMADRFTTSVPELSDFVSARAKGISTYLTQHENDFDQIVQLGAGYDMKSTDFSREECDWFCLDLKQILDDRKIKISEEDGSIHVPGDIRMDNWQQSLLKNGFSPDKKTLFILEGKSMYLATENLVSLFSQIDSLSGHKDNRIWMDHLSGRVFESENAKTHNFVVSATRLGDPMYMGFDDFAGFTDQWQQQSCITAAEISGIKNELFEGYCFSVLAPCKK